MNAYSRALLEQIGRQLDQSVFPVVHNGGLVLPGPSAVASIIPGKEFHHEGQQQRSSRSATGSRNRPEAGARSAGAHSADRSRTSAASTPLAFVDGYQDIDDAVQQLKLSYPVTKVWRQEEGLWLFVESTLLPDLGRSAGFVIALDSQNRHVRAWGFWLGAGVAVSWIGPRHTNYPDGSICAFDVADGTWTFGDSLVTLVDMYSAWSVRQLYLEHFGRWPGPQSSSHAYERLIEFSDSDHCSCGVHGARYGECCKGIDKRLRLLAIAVNFSFTVAFRQRKPPASVIGLALHRTSATPLIATLTT